MLVHQFICRVESLACFFILHDLDLVVKGQDLVEDLSLLLHEVRLRSKGRLLIQFSVRLSVGVLLVHLEPLFDLFLAP